MVSQWLSGWKLIHYGLISQIGINPTPRLRCFIVDISSEFCLWSCLNPCLKKLAPRVLTEHQIHVEDQQISLLHIHILDKTQIKPKISLKKIIMVVLNSSYVVSLRSTATKMFQIQLSHNWIMTMFYSRVWTSKEFSQRDYQVKGQKMNNVLWLHCHDL